MTGLTPTDLDNLRSFAGTGSQEAFRALTERYAGLVFSAAYRRTGQRALAEEIAQNVFAVLARKAGALAHPGVQLAAWLHRATVLESARAQRKESTRKRIMEDYHRHVEVVEPAQSAAWENAVPELDAALDALPARDRELLIARFFDERSYRELAATLRRSEAALMQQQHRALEKLSALLRKRGVAAPVAILAGGLSTGLAQPAPAGLAASLAASAPVVASHLGHTTLLIHAFNTLMQTKTRLTLAAAATACFLGGTGAFVIGRSQAEARSEARFRHTAQLRNIDRPLPVTPPATIQPSAAPLSLQAKLDQAAAGWRLAADLPGRLQALEVVDAVAPDEVATAHEFLESLRAESGLHLELSKRIATLWGFREPAPALQWLIEYLPREHRGSPINFILAGWSRREPHQALAWWQRTADSLEFPIPEDAFQQLEIVIYAGWGAHDPAGLIETLPEIAGFEQIESHDDPELEARVMGLARAAVDPPTRAATLTAIRAIPHEGTRAAVAGMTGIMMGISDPEASRAFALSLTFSDAGTRERLLGETAMMSVMMQQQSPVAAISWLREHTSEANARKVVETFARETDDAPMIEALRAALEVQ